MRKVERYQSGTLELVKTSLGMCWYIRFTSADGKRPRHRIGLKSEFPTKPKASRAAQHLRDLFNSPTEETLSTIRTFGDLIDRYKREEMPSRYSTAKSYGSFLRCHIEPRWGTVPLHEVRAQAVREWLDSLELSPKTKGHIRDLVRILFRFGMLWEWIPQGINPITLFQIKGSTKREKKPRSLTTDEFAALLKEIPDEPYRTMMQVVGCLGISCSELAGLRWENIDWLGGWIHIKTGVVDGRVGETKTEARKKGIPLHPKLAALLEAHRKASFFIEPAHWVFASPHTAGKKTYHVGRIQQYVIAPAAIRAGLGEGIGWHSLRHSYRSWLGDSGASIEQQRDLLRHSDIRTTMNIYGDTFNEALRPANEKVISKILT